MNIWKIIYLNRRERYKDMIDHSSYTHNLSSCEIKAWKKFRPERDSNAWPLQYVSIAVLHQLSYQAMWELVTLWVRNIPVDGEEYKWILVYERSYIWTAVKDVKTWIIIAVMYTNLNCCEIKAWKKFRLERDSNPWPLQYRCSALPTELLSELGAGHFVSS